MKRPSVKRLLVCFLVLSWFSLGVVKEAKAWWDSDYQYRKKITITNNSGDNIDGDTSGTGTIVGFTDDTASLISGDKLRSDGKDWRIVYDDGSSESEIAQKIEGGWNTSSTETWFRLQADILNSESDGDYYAYYGYSSESTSPSALTTPSGFIYKQENGTGQTAQAIDHSDSEWGGVQEFEAKRNNDSWSVITDFDFGACWNRTGGTTAKLAPFIFDGMNEAEGDEITNGRGDEFENDDVVIGNWNNLTFSSPYPKIKDQTIYYCLFR